jgi:hypothetical protein
MSFFETEHVQRILAYWISDYGDFFPTETTRCILSVVNCSDVEAEAEAEAEAPEAVAFWWKKEVEAEAPKNMPLPLPLCFKAGVQILVDFCELEVVSFRFCLCLSKLCQNHSCFFLDNDVKYHIINYINTFQKEKEN